MHQRSLFWILSLVLLIALPMAEAEPNDTAAKIKIGIILPLSGEAASLGTYAKNGIELAYENLPPAERKSVQLLFEDDQLKPTQSVTAARKLIEQEHITALVTMSSGVGNAVAPIAERNKVLMLAVGASDANVAKGRRYVFTHWITPEAEADEITKELAKRGYQRIAWIGQEHEGINAIYNAELKALSRMGLRQNLILDQKFLPADKDFRSYIALAHAKQVDAVLVALFPGALSSFAKQAQESNLTADLVGFEMFEDFNEVKAAKGALLNRWYVNSSRASSEFSNLYRKAYGEPPQISSPNTFDALMLMVQSLTNSKGDTLEAADHLRKLKDYEGAAGRYSATGDNRFALPAELKVVRSSGFESLYP